MPPRVEETKTRVLFLFSCNLINHIWSKLCKEKILFQPSAIIGEVVPLIKEKWLSRGATTTTVLLIFWTLCLFSLYLNNKNHIYDWFCLHQFIIFKFSKLYIIVRISLICNLRFP